MSNVESKNCPQCGAPTDPNATVCKFCGAEIAAQQQYQVPQYQVPQYQVPQNAPLQVPQYQTPPAYRPELNTSGKNKTTAGILGILLGGLGAHKFYLGKPGMGILYLIFFWTYVPAIIGFIEGIVYLTSTDEKFFNSYVRK